MRINPVAMATFVLIGLLGAQTGCQRGAGGASFLSLFGLSEKPVVIALTAEPGVLDPFTPHEKLRQAMSTAIDRPVRLDLSLPIQIAPNLSLGFYDFAMVTPACYADMNGRSHYELVASSVDEHGYAGRAALLVIAADADPRQVGDLRGKKIAFGPRRDSRTHYAALALLRENAIKPTDLELELLPLPGSLRHVADARERLRGVLEGGADAAFIDAADFDDLPETGDDAGPTRDDFRIIARTVGVPDRIVIRSPKADDAVVAAVGDFLLKTSDTDPEALRPLLISGYQPPTDKLRAACARLANPEPMESDEE